MNKSKKAFLLFLINLCSFLFIHNDGWIFDLNFTKDNGTLNESDVQEHEAETLSLNQGCLNLAISK